MYLPEYGVCRGTGTKSDFKDQSSKKLLPGYILVKLMVTVRLEGLGQNPMTSS
jgi:hypothetical protein